MPKTRIVTDSSAQFFDPLFPTKHDIVVAPLTIHFGKRSFRENLEISTEQFLKLSAEDGIFPVAASPTVEQFAAIYEDLSRSGDNIISIHASSKLNRTFRNARVGAEGLRGRCKIEVIDSLSISSGLGMLVEAAALAAERGEPLEEIVRIVRRMIPRLYTVFFIETLDFLANAGRIGKAQSTLGAMLGIKPCLTMDDGDIVPMEKVRTRAQAVEKLVEFVSEFSTIDSLAILQSTVRPTEDTRLLLEQLALAFPGREWSVLVYGPTLATFLGPDAMGVMVLEGESEEGRVANERNDE